MNFANEKIRKISEAIITMLDDISLIQKMSKNGSILNSEILTNYLIKAFKNAGLPNFYTPLREAKKWCLTVTEQHKEINPFILHSLILLGEENQNYVQEKLNELRTRSRKSDGRFEVPTGYLFQGDLFSTMFVIEIILDLSNTSKYFKKEEIEQSLNWVIEHIQDISKIKEIGFLIYLLARHDPKKYNEIIEELSKSIYPHLEELLKDLEKSINSGKFDYISRNNKLETLLWLLYDLIDIENSKIKGLINKAMDMLNTLLISFVLPFYHPERELTLHENDIWFKVRTASLIISIYSKYYKENITNVILEILLNDREQITTKKLYYLHFGKEIRDVERFKDIIRKWIIVNIDDRTELTGGMSDTEVYRIKPEIIIPIYKQKYPLPSVIIKRSNTQTFEKELQNYAIIPNFLKRFFAEISTESSLSVTENNILEIFLIMQDLAEYSTLNEILNRYDVAFNKVENKRVIEEKLNKLISYVCMELKFLYENSIKREKNSAVIAHYFEDIFKSLSLLSIKGLDVGTFEKILTYLQEKYRDITSLEPNFATFMHGDLNSRNIMIKIENNKYDFKLIDIDSINLFGDYIFDIGELYVDITYNLRNIGKIIGGWIEKYFRDFADQLGDRTFEERLKLAKIRSFIKLAKIHAKRDKVEKVEELIKEVLKLIN